MQLLLILHSGYQIFFDDLLILSEFDSIIKAGKILILAKICQVHEHNHHRFNLAYAILHNTLQFTVTLVYYSVVSHNVRIVNR